MPHPESPEQVFDSLTGFDEIAIAQKFGRTVSELATKDESMFGRALVFTLKRRDGSTDDDAWNEAMGMSVKEFTGYFAEPSEAEAGKGEEHEPRPAISLSSA